MAGSTKEADISNQLSDALPEVALQDIDLDGCNCCGECNNCKQACNKLVGQFIMLKAQPDRKGAKYYAAKVIASVPDSTDLTLSWFPGNIYESNEKPLSEVLSLSVGDVWDAYKDLFLPEDLAYIQWPIALYDDAHELFAYTNTAITEALEEAQGSIIQIVTNSGQHQHPIVPYFKGWVGETLNSRLADSFQYDCFTYDLLPGD